jgi:hypothetical protein
MTYVGLEPTNAKATPIAMITTQTTLKPVSDRSRGHPNAPAVA